MSLPSKPVRKVAPAGNSYEGKATGGLNTPKPNRKTATSVGKEAYNRQAVGLNSGNAPMKRTPEGPDQPHARGSSQSMSSLKKGVD